MPNEKEKQKYQIDTGPSSIEKILSKAKTVGSDPSRSGLSKQRELRKKYPKISAVGDLLTGGATNPDFEPGIVDLLLAGLPFSSIIKSGKVFHGTQKVFDKFDPELNNKGDVLGWLTHFAENPKYAEKFSEGLIKGKRSNRENIIPANIQAKNVLDLVNPNSDDISQILAAFDPSERKNLIQNFKLARADRPFNKAPLSSIAEKITTRMKPELFERSPFDAIRYTDMNEKSWAVPTNKTLVTTSYGTPLTDIPKKLKVLKTDKPSGGELTLETSPSFIVFDPRTGKKVTGFNNEDDIIDFFSSGKNNNLDYLPSREFYGGNK